MVCGEQEREGRPTGCSRCHAVGPHCSVRSGPKERSIRKEQTVRSSKAAESLLCACPVWLPLADHPPVSGPGLPSQGCVRPHGHGAVAALRWQDKRNCRDLRDTEVWGHKGEETTLGNSLENIPTAFE